jgi:hypothetical protein
LYTQTAPKTFIAAANATRRLFANAANAIKRAVFQEGSRERMDLALAHLQTVAQQTPPPLPPRDARVEDLIDAYAAPGLPPGFEILARVIARWGYRFGCCYASQETLARWMGISESGVQRLVMAMENLGFLHVDRRPGTSSIIILADGTLDALRIKKMRKITTYERTHPYVERSFTMPDPETLEKIKLSARKKSGFGSQNTSCSQQSISSTKSEYRSRTVVSTTSSKITTISRAHVSGRASAKPNVKNVKSEKIPVKSSEYVKNNVIDNETKPQEKPVIQSLHGEHVTRKNDNEAQQKPAVITLHVEHTPPQNGKEGEKKAVAPSVSSHQPLPKAAALLVAQGVTPKRAREFAQLFDYEQIERNVALGLHRGKNNPPGYLLTLIRDDPASRRVVPGSEADQVRRRERPGAQRERNGPVKALEAREPVPSAISPPQPKSRASEAVCGTFSGVSEVAGGVEDPLEALSPEDRDQYACRAREEVLRANAWLGASPREGNPIMQAMIRTQLRAMLATTKAPASRGAPSG